MLVIDRTGLAASCTLRIACLCDWTGLSTVYRREGGMHRVRDEKFDIGIHILLRFEYVEVIRGRSLFIPAICFFFFFSLFLVFTSGCPRCSRVYNNNGYNSN